MSRNLAHLSSSHNHLPTRSAQTMLFPNFYTAMLLLLLTLMQFNPSFQTCTKNPHSLAIVNKAALSNLHHFFASTKDSRETHVQLMRDQVLQVVLNNHGMNDVSTKEVSNRTIVKHLSVSRQSVAKHRSNKIPFKKVQPSKKKPGLTKKAFIFKHNALCQLMVKFWLDHSTPSPNKKDVRWVVYVCCLCMLDGIIASNFNTSMKNLCAQVCYGDRLQDIQKVLIYLSFNPP